MDTIKLISAKIRYRARKLIEGIKYLSSDALKFEFHAYVISGHIFEFFLPFYLIHPLLNSYEQFSRSKFQPHSSTDMGGKFWTLPRDAQLNIYFSKLICAEISQMTGASNRVFHQTVNSQNSMLSKEIHDQGKKDFFKLSQIESVVFYYTTKC